MVAGHVNRNLAGFVRCEGKKHQLAAVFEHDFVRADRRPPDVEILEKRDLFDFGGVYVVKPDVPSVFLAAVA